MIDNSGTFIKKFDIKFINHSHPHIVNCRMSRLRKKAVNVSGKRLQLGGKYDKCWFQDFNGRLTQTKGHGIWAILVGEVGEMKLGNIT
jgi:hypothetical protein